MPDTKRPRFILASASPRRLQLLKQAGIVPDDVVAPDIDETPLKTELPDKYALRCAEAKASVVAAKHPEAVVLTADTVVACGRRILPKAEDEETARHCLTLLSGRRHRVYTAVCVMRGGKMRTKLAMTQLRFSRLDEDTIAQYVASKEWHGKAGGYAIQGLAEAFTPWISGSYSNVVGLPLPEAVHLLKQAGLTW
jgi:septum formation protein